MSFEDMYLNFNVKARQKAIDEITLMTNICWFCNKPQATKECASEIYLHQNLKTEFRLGSRKYQWEEISRKVPCCQKCDITHKRANGMGSFFAWLGGIIGFISGIVLPFFIVIELHLEPTKIFNSVMLASVFGGIFLGAIGGNLLGRKLAFSSSPETKPVKFAAQHPLIDLLIEEGWKFGKPNIKR